MVSKRWRRGARRIAAMVGKSDAFVSVPDGPGPHPAIVFHHGSNGLMAAAAAGMSALVDAGYVVLAGVRRGHER